MSIHPALAQIDQVLLPSVRDLGDGFMVRRALPAPQRQMVGPFIFLDAYGPTLLKIDQGFDSRPHPHIGLSTMSYLLQGQVLHRDNQGNAQVVRPGEVGLMTAGRGIVHSERTPRDVRATGGVLQGFQTWIALPVGHEETAPAFQHVSAEDLPLLEGEGVSLRLLAGTLLGKRAATRTFSDLFAADVTLARGARLRIDDEHVERAVHVASGAIQVEGQDETFGPDQLVVFKPGAQIVLQAREPARLLLLGGEPFAEQRHVFWNFVSTRRELIEAAAENWRERRYPLVPGDEVEFTPLPDTARRS